MTEPQPAYLEVPEGHRIAYRHTPGAAPGVLFCGGYTSDMTGTKATALEAHCRQTGRAFTRFDYMGHGQSGGRFEDGTIGLWAEDAVQVLDRVSDGPTVVIGSSMGGWVMLLLALARPGRVGALLGIAAAPDFTEDLLLPRAEAAQLEQLDRQGYWIQPSAYGDDPYVVTRALLEDGRRNLVLRAPIAIDCPVHLLHGQRDEAVPWQTSLTLAERLRSDEVTVELVKAGDHRLSRESDLERLLAVVDHLAGATGRRGGDA
ncbi:MAG: alpha/beta hydrolase [Geminicoccaceae bacterium]|nr:alpha/beta hydrolase [Geminicoccaceae bacterium]